MKMLPEIETMDHGERSNKTAHELAASGGEVYPVSHGEMQDGCASKAKHSLPAKWVRDIWYLSNEK